ncbi:hypothetical protein Tco_0525290 [Tanacetum coccineum]
MNPDHYQLAKEECEQQVSQGIIEPTTSPWACEAFYVNKRSEQLRGKLRLVINYQPLNHFLADDKFLLPQKKSLFQHLADARILSKFDLKSGFWQFAFQKAMITIFEPILANTLVYIDDILLFSPDEQSHAELLLKFYSLVAKYGIMLSEKKIEVGASRQTEAVKAIKSLAKKMPPLKIPASSEKRILQTDAKSEQHYHSMFKEILVVKRGIEKFQFHLIGHEFQVKMDMSSFPRMLQFKRKMLPHAQLLRWSNWFSQWKFTVKHIKGTENVLADFLSRPKAYKSEENYPKEASQVQKHTPHLLSMVFSVASHKEEGSSSTPTPPIPVFDLPEEIVETIGDLTFEKRAKLCYKTFLTILLKNHGLCIKGLRFHPDYPFLNIFHIHDLWRFPKEALCFFYYLFESFTIGITFNAEKLLSYVVKSQFKDVPPTLNIYLLCYNGLSHITNGPDG